MSICFHSSRPFAIKVYAGGINVVSGERANGDMGTLLRRKEKVLRNESIQYYVVQSHDQGRLHNIGKLDGQMMQFVAILEGSSHSIEAQMTGNNHFGSLQFEVILQKNLKPNMITIGIGDDLNTAFFNIMQYTLLQQVFERYRSHQDLRERNLRLFRRGKTILGGK